MRAVVRIDHRRLWIVSHAAGAEKMHGELLLPSRETPLFLRAGGLKQFMRAGEQPISKLQIIRMILVGQSERRQAQASFRSGSSEKLLFSRGRDVPWQKISMVRLKSCATAALKSLPQRGVPGDRPPKAKLMGVKSNRASSPPPP